MSFPFQLTFKVSKGTSLDSSCKTLFRAREGRHSNALQALSSQGVAGHDDDSAYQNLLNRHPSPFPDTNKVSSNSFIVDELIVLSCL